jgi:hypothetical protein
MGNSALAGNLLRSPTGRSSKHGFSAALLPELWAELSADPNLTQPTRDSLLAFAAWGGATPTSAPCRPDDVSTPLNHKPLTQEIFGRQ